MKVKHLIFSCIILFFFHNSYGQGKLTFTKDLHDFGTVKEGSPATYSFEFTNIGDTPVLISNVSASCGCTTPEWTKDPVLPGKKGKITASYNTQGRPGAFNKTVTVVSNAETPTVMLTIKGNVLAKPVEAPKPPTPQELTQSPVLNLGKTTHNFGKIEKNQPVSHIFEFKNAGKSDLWISGIQSNCSCVLFRVSKPTIPPGQTATIELKYTPKAAMQHNEEVTLLSNDLKNPRKTIILQANVVESLTSQSVVKEQKPALPFQ